MAEIYFYHLERKPLEAVLPGLLQRSLERGWRCVVEAAEERAASLDDLLWTYADDSFLPHGLEADDGAEQPVVIVSHGGNPNGAAIRFIVDSAPIPEDAGSYERVVILIDGNDDEAVAAARGQWSEARKRNLAVTYWQQDEAGRWQKRG